MALPASVGADATASFRFNVTAPAFPGTYNFQWRMAHGATLFGALSTNVQVANGLDAASFVSQSVPAQMVPGQTYSVSVTLANTGPSTWSPGTQFKLGSVNPVDNTTWGPSRVELPADVPPGTSVTIPFNVVAPATAGTYNFQWRMLHDAVAFGASTQNLAVTVGAASPLAGMMYIHVDHLNTPRAIYDSAQQLRWKWDQQEPFGVNPPDENPSSLGAYEFNLRFPGQYFDKETNQHYSYLRDCYDSAIGRFCQPDPVGVALFRTLAFQGLSNIPLVHRETAISLFALQPRYNHLYGYVDGGPVSLTDPMGLQKSALRIAIETQQGYENNDAKAECQFGCTARFFRSLVLDDVAIHGIGHVVGLGAKASGWASVGGFAFAVWGERECMESCRNVVGSCKPLGLTSSQPPDSFSQSLGLRLGNGP